MTEQNVHQIVDEMSAQVRQGQSPDLLVQFLRNTFKESDQRRLSRLFLGPWTYQVSSIGKFEDDGFFRRTCIFYVRIRDGFLEVRVLPGASSLGLFSLDDEGFRYLNHRKDYIEDLLRKEARPNECPPKVLASLLTEALGSKRCLSHDVLESPDYLINYQRPGKVDPDDCYEINSQEWERVQPYVISPELSGDSESGWILEFCSIFGWMHEKQKLIRHRYRISPDFRIKCEEGILSQKIFKSTPHIRY